jgi:hypothetical protein
MTKFITVFAMDENNKVFRTIINVKHIVSIKDSPIKDVNTTIKLINEDIETIDKFTDILKKIND